MKYGVELPQGWKFITFTHVPLPDTNPGRKFAASFMNPELDVFEGIVCAEGDSPEEAYKLGVQKIQEKLSQVKKETDG